MMHVCDGLLDRASDIAALYNINPSIPRRAERKQHKQQTDVEACIR